MIIVAVVIIVLIIKKVIELFFLPNLDSKKKAWGLNAILFWGSFNFIFGIYVQTAGLWAALKEIITAPDLSPPIMIMGFLGSFMSTLFGAATLVVAALCWWLLRARLRSMK
jgi:hypothetical protein